MADIAVEVHVDDEQILAMQQQTQAEFDSIRGRWVEQVFRLLAQVLAFELAIILADSLLTNPSPGHFTSLLFAALFTLLTCTTHGTIAHISVFDYTRRWPDWRLLLAVIVAQGISQHLAYVYLFTNFVHSALYHFIVALPSLIISGPQELFLLTMMTLFQVVLGDRSMEIPPDGDRDEQLSMAFVLSIPIMLIFGCIYLAMRFAIIMDGAPFNMPLFAGNVSM